MSARLCRPWPPRAWLTLGALLAWLIAAPCALGEEPSGPVGALYARLVHACPPPQGRSASCFAVMRRAVSSKASAGPGARAYTGDGDALSFGPAGGFTPALLAGAYHYNAAGGSGQTVGIVDAYDDPKIEEDLAIFDGHYGLGPCTKANGCLRKLNQRGSESPQSLPVKDTKGWSQEIALDVETVRAVCQGCKILLIEAENPEYSNLAKAVDEAVALGASEISNSYGGPEEGMEPEERAAYDHPGVVIAAATGDYGYDDWNYPLLGFAPPDMPNAPASLPTVVSVGGTSLRLNGGGSRASETVWNDDGLADENELAAGYVTSGGCSTLFTAQPWQEDAAGFSATGCGGKRLAADVSADADPETGFDIFDNYNYCGTGSECQEVKEAIERYGGWETFGGTSLSTPVIASLYALAGGSAGLRYPALSLYGHLGEASSLYDVSQGGSGYCDAEPAPACGHPNVEFDAEREYVLDCEGTSACDARTGFDGPSGVGTPNGLAAFTPLFPTASIAPPTSLVAGAPAAFSSAASRDPYPGGAISGWSWSWGDTAGSHEADPTHVYAAAGEYTVSLTVVDNYGLASTTATDRVHVLSEAEAKLKREEEAAATKREEEAAAKKHEEEATAKGREEEATTVKRREEAAAKGREEEAAAKRVEEGAGKKREEEIVTSKHEDEAANKREEEAASQRKHEEEKALVSPVAGQQTAGFQALLTPAAPRARLVGTALKVSASGVVAVKISCPSGESSCAGTLTLRTLAAVTAALSRASTARVVLTLASGPFAVAGGKVATIKLHLSARALALLKRVHVLRARAAIIAHDPLGARYASQTIVTLRSAPSVEPPRS